jgi:prepilin peptidase CpaA
MGEGRAPSVDDLPESVGKLPYAVAIAAGTLGYIAWRQTG